MFVNENHSDWDEHLPTVLMAYRTAVQESTGQTPARLMMGHELRVPLDLMFGQPPGSSLEVQKAWKYRKLGINSSIRTEQTSFIK